MLNTQRRSTKVALAHDWLTGMRGGEAVLERLCVRYPHAPLYTLFHRPGSVSSVIENRHIVASFLDALPAARAHYQHLLPLYPAAVEAFDLSAFDLVVSTSHCAIKALRIAPHAEHVCYVHTPMRYIYEQFDDYFGADKVGRLTHIAMRSLRPILQQWDRHTAQRPTRLVANSRNVAARCRRYWQRDADVVCPPVQLERFAPIATSDKKDFYLVVSALVPYKRIDLAIQACCALGRRLVIVGDGAASSRLQQQYASDLIEFRGRLANSEIAILYAQAQALLFPGEEDFGITPLEAQASGTPVIAFGKGGALETVLGIDEDDATGVFFDKQEVSSMLAAMKTFEHMKSRLRTENLVAQSRNFSVAHFDSRMASILDDVETRLALA